MVLTGFCCMKLRTAGLVLGWLGMAASVISMASILNQLSNYDPNEIPSEYESHRTFEGGIIILSITLFNILVTGLLINGISSNRHRFLLPWLIVKGSILFFIIPIIFLLLATAVVSNDLSRVAASILLLMIIGFWCYCWMAIYSLYKEIRDTAKKSLTFYERASEKGATIPYQLFEKY